MLVNVLIGVVITSLDEARSMEADADTAQDRAGTRPVCAADPALLRDRVAAARRALDDLERALAAAPNAGSLPPQRQPPLERAGPAARPLADDPH